MALKPAQNLELIQVVYVNGLPMHQFSRYWDDIQPGDTLRLMRDRGNIHDAKAVKVCLEQHQLGWVPKVSNKNIAERLDRGEVLVTKVQAVGQDHLTVAVYAAAAPQGAKVSVYPSDLNPTGMAELLSYAAGTPFPLHTSFDRSSTTIMNPEGRDCAWFRESDLPEKLLNRKDVYATVNQDKTGRFIEIRVGSIAEKLSPTGRPESRPQFQEFPRTEEPVYSWTSDLMNETQTTTTTKENTMTISTLVTTTIEANKSAAGQAAYLEAGRIANNQLVKVAAKTLPFMARGYADTALGRLLIANAATMAAAQLRPQDKTLAKLTNAMTVAAYSEVLQSFDLDSMIDNLLASPEIQTAMRKMDKE